jgi:hypothetical protein
VLKRAAHAAGLFVAIVAAVATFPVVVAAVAAAAVQPSATPEWWNALRWAAVAVFVLALAFLVWDTHRIKRTEERGMVVWGLRVPPKRSRSRRSA